MVTLRYLYLCVKNSLLWSFLIRFSTESGHDFIDFPESPLEARASPLPHHISKRDISLPTKTAGPLFTSQADILGLDDEDVEDVVEERPGSINLEDTLTQATVQQHMRARVSRGTF